MDVSYGAMTADLLQAGQHQRLTRAGWFPDTSAFSIVDIKPGMFHYGSLLLKVLPDQV